MRYICHKSWLGGWLLPQKKSYFALQLPKGWWIFGLDLALHGDIDVYQFKFFAELCNDKVHFALMLTSQYYTTVILLRYLTCWTQMVLLRIEISRVQTYQFLILPGILFQISKLYFLSLRSHLLGPKVECYNCSTSGVSILTTTW